jgi:hypothetical protein
VVGRTASRRRSQVLCAGLKSGMKRTRGATMSGRKPSNPRGEQPTLGESGSSGVAPTSAPRAWFQIVVTAATLGAALALAGLYAYYVMFSDFSDYDDEGFLDITVRHFLAGRPIYDDVFTQYGRSSISLTLRSSSRHPSRSTMTRCASWSSASGSRARCSAPSAPFA